MENTDKPVFHLFDKLNVLLRKQTARELRHLKTIPLDQIVTVHQPRTKWEDIEKLAASLSVVGQLKPIVVYHDSSGKYLIEEGENDYFAAKVAGLKSLHCFVSNADPIPRVLRQLLAKVQHQKVTLADVSLAIHLLHEEEGFSNREIARMLGMSEAATSMMRKIANLPPPLERLKQLGIVKDLHALYGLLKPYEEYPKKVEQQVKKWEKESRKDGANPTFTVSRSMVNAFIEVLKAKNSAKPATKLALTNIDAKEDNTASQKAASKASSPQTTEINLPLPIGCERNLDRQLGLFVMYKGKRVQVVTNVLAPEGKLCIFNGKRLLAVRVDEVSLAGVDFLE